MRSHLVHLVISESVKKNITVAEFAKRMYISEKSAYNSYYHDSKKRSYNQTVSTIMALSEALEVEPYVVLDACIKDREDWCKNA